MLMKIAFEAREPFLDNDNKYIRCSLPGFGRRGGGERMRVLVARRGWRLRYRRRRRAEQRRHRRGQLQGN